MIIETLLNKQVWPVYTVKYSNMVTIRDSADLKAPTREISIHALSSTEGRIDFVKRMRVFWTEE